MPAPRFDSDDLLLLPRPSRVEVLGAPLVLAAYTHPIAADHVSNSGDPATTAGQAYTLTTHPPDPRGHVATITATTAAGLRHGHATLAQLWRAHRPRLPHVRITDEPTFPIRGVMLDVSRDRVPTMPELFGIVDTLARLKINHLQLYTEHTFAYAGHEAAWQGWAPITPDELRRLDDHCHSRGIELAASQNCFGHLAAWLRLPQYAHLAETHGDWMFDVWPRSGPFSLCPTDPASLAFVKDLLGQLLPCLRSRRINIGCDETYDVGYGRSAASLPQALAGRPSPPATAPTAQVGRMSRPPAATVNPAARATLYTRFVSQIAAAACEIGGRGTRPMFWADIALSHPERLADLPTNLTALAWGYEPESPFDCWCDTLSRPPRAGGADVPSARSVWLAPGTSSWRSISGRTTERRGNINAAASAGLSALARGQHIEGFLICDWGDTGHHQQWPIALLGIADGANAAWNAHASAAFDPRAASLHALGDVSLAAGPWLAVLGEADHALRQVALGLSRPGQTGRLLNQSALFIDMHKPLADSASLDPAACGPIGLWAQSRDRVEALAAAMPRGLSPLLHAELDLTARVARFAGARGHERRRDPSSSPASPWRRALAEDLRAIMADHAHTWLARSRRGGTTSTGSPGGLARSLMFYESILASLTT